ncbi:MAG: ABC transporter permease [Kiritimatiellae bacterium]|nr:ABC transporter permease [Kiritimatiellia bacterium]
MTLGATLGAYLLGIPGGIALALSDKRGLRPCAPLYRLLDVACNLLRSVPFIILLVVLIPFTRAVAGRSYGSTATIVPLVVSAAPFVARLVESSLKEVDRGVVEAAESMGAGTARIVLRVLLPEARTSLVVGVTIALGTVLGYSAMAGAVGGGGLGDIAIQYGYYRYETRTMLLTLVLLVGVAQFLQWAGMRLARRLDRRRPAA